MCDLRRTGRCRSDLWLLRTRVSCDSLQTALRTWSFVFRTLRLSSSRYFVCPQRSIATNAFPPTLLRSVVPSVLLAPTTHQRSTAGRCTVESSSEFAVANFRFHAANGRFSVVVVFGGCRAMQSVQVPLSVSI